MKKRPVKAAQKTGKKPSARKKPPVQKKPANRQNQSQLDTKLLNLPHSSLGRINQSLRKLEDFSSVLADRSGLTAILGRAILLRASAIRASLSSGKLKKPVKKPVKKPLKNPMKKPLKKKAK